MRTTIENGKFRVDGKPFRILSGEMHYFRIPRNCWENRLRKLKACGLNTVSTYMPWNLHERIQGKFDFSGMLDVRSFLGLADKLGLKVILRPGPYICSEWEFGGFPAWLLTIRGLRLRCAEQQYLAHVKHYFEEVFREVRDFYSKNVILLQIENGYASYGNDMEYYRFLKKLVDDSGYENVVIAADGDSDTRISTEVPPGVWRTLMCGLENPVPQLEFNQAEQPGMPQLIIEYWNGQHMSTGQSLRLRDPEQIVHNLEKALEWGAHINLYMFHGGSNFGFMNGAMRTLCGWYSQLISSYDTCAPLTESGDVTKLYRIYRKVFAKYNPDFSPDTPVPSDSEKRAYGEVLLTEFASLVENLDALSMHSRSASMPLTLEEVGGDYGFVRYTTHLAAQSFPLPVTLCDYQDRGWAFYNGKKVSRFGQDKAEFTLPANSSGILEIVIENMGRTNFYCTIENNRKGISGGVLLNHQQFQHGWKTAAMPMEDLSGVHFSPVSETTVPIVPGFFRGTFFIDGNPSDTFLTVPSGNSGFCRINGTLLGRYDKRGPLYTLYTPASFLRKGENVVEVFEYEMLERPVVKFLDHPLGILHLE